MIKEFFKKYRKNQTVKKDKEILGSLVEEGNEHLDKLKKIDQQILCIQKSTKTTFYFFSPIHNYCRTKYAWYDNWSVKPYATKVHAGVLALVLVSGLAIGSFLLIGKPNTAKAAAVSSVAGTWNWSNPCAWSSAVDCATTGVVPSPGDIITIIASSTVTLDADRSVASVTINSGGALDISNRTLTLSDSGTPLVATGTFTTAGSTIKYTGTSATNIIAATYNNLELIPAGTVTYTLGAGTFTISGNLVIGNGTNAVTVTTVTYNPVINIAGNFTINANAIYTKSTSLTTFNGTTAATFTDNTTTKQNIGPISITKTNGDSAFNKLTLTTGMTSIIMTISASNTLDISNQILSLSGASLGSYATPLTVTGAFITTGSTVKYIGGKIITGTTINFSYHNLEIIPPYAATTYTLGTAVSPAITCTGYFTIGDGVNNSTITAATRNPVINIAGDFTIVAGNIYTKGTGLTTFNGATAATYTDSTAGIQNIGAVSINKTNMSDPATNDKLTLASAMKVSSLIIDGTAGQADTLDLNGNNFSFFAAATIVNDGTLQLKGNETLTNFTNDTDSGAVIYNGTSDYTITPGNLAAGNNYYNLTFNGTGGSWKLGAALDVNGNFTNSAGTFDANGQDMTVANNWTNSGTFTHSNGTVTFNGTTTGNYIVEPTSFYNLTINSSNGDGVWSISDSAALSVANDLTMTAGTLRDDNDTVATINGNVAGTNGIINFANNASTFIQRVAANKSFGATSGSTNWTFNSLNFENSSAGDLTVTTASTATGQIIVGGTLTVGNAGDSNTTTLDNETNDRIIDANGNVAITSKGTLSASSTVPLTIGGNYSNAGTLTANSGTVTFDGTTTQTITGTNTWYNLTINNTYATPDDTYDVDPDSAQTVTNIFTITHGQYSPVTGDSYKNVSIANDAHAILKPDSGVTITVSGNWSRGPSGVFTANSGTITFNGAVAQTITGSNTWYNLTIASTAATPSDTYDVDPSSAQTVTNTFLISDGQYSAYTGDSYKDVSVTANSPSINGRLMPDAGSNITVSGNWNKDVTGTFTAGTGTVTFNGTTTQTITGTNTWYNLTINNTYATPDDTYDVDPSSAQTVTNTFIITHGQYSPVTGDSYKDVSIAHASSHAILKPDSGVTITVSGNWNRAGSGVFTANGGTVIFNGSTTQTISGMASTNAWYNLTIANTTATPDDTYDVDPSNAQTVTNTFLISDGQYSAYTGDSYKDISITSTSPSINGRLVPDAGASITVSGNWTINLGTFAAGTGTVSFVGTNPSTLTGSTTFYNLTMNTTGIGNKTITFPTGTGNKQIISNTWVLDGNTSEVLTLVSASPTTAWYFDIPAGFTSGDYIDVMDSYSANTNKITPGTNVTNSGNNSGWLFNTAPNAPTTLGPSSYVDGVWQTDNTPTLTFNLTDPDGADQVKYEIVISTHSDFSVPTIDYTSDLGAQGARSYTADPTLADGQYYWKVKTIDASNVSSGYSIAGDAGTADIKVDTAVPVTDIYLNPTNPNGTNDYYKTTAPTVTFTADDGTGSGASTIYYRWGATGDFSAYSVGISAPEGTNTIYYYGTDLAGNSGSSSPFSRTIKTDITSPSTPGTPSATTPTNILRPSWSWGASTDGNSGMNKYEVQLNSGSWIDIGNTHSWTTTSDLSAGTNTLKVRATDNAGNTSVDSEAGSILVDLTAPTISTFIINNGDATATSADITLQITASDSSSGLSARQFSQDGITYSDWESCDNTTCNAEKAYTLNAGDGTKTVYLKVKDVAGNESDASSDTILLDTTGPSAFSLYSPANDSWGNSTSIHLSWEATADLISGLQKYQLYLDDAIINDNISNSITSYDLSNLSVGTHTWQVKAIDSLNNETLSEKRTFSIDQTAPTAPTNVTVTNLSNTDLKLVKDMPVKIAWTRSEDAGAGVSSYLIYIGTTPGASDIINGEEVGTPNYDANLQTDGTYFVTIKAKDGAGNISTLSEEYSFEVDHTAPNTIAKTVSFDISNRIASTYSSYIAWSSSSDPSGEGIKEYVVYSGNEKIATIPFNTNGKESPRRLVQTGLKPGSYSFKVAPVDLADNFGAFSAESKLEILAEAGPALLISEIAATPSTLVDPDSGKTSILVSWKTNTLSTSVVEMEGKSYGEEDLAKLNTGHSILITGLKASTTYRFIAKSRDIFGGQAESESTTVRTGAIVEKQSTLEIILNSLRDIFSIFQRASATALQQIGLIKPTQITKEGLIAFNVSDPDAGNAVAISLVKAGQSIEKSTDGKSFSSLATPSDNYYIDDQVTEENTYYYRLSGSSGIARINIGNKEDSAPVISDPKVIEEATQVADDKVRVAIGWQTDIPSTSQISYGIGSTDLESTKDESLNTNHFVVIEGLKSGTEYKFKAKSLGENNLTSESSEFAFVTPKTVESQSIINIIVRQLQDAFAKLIAWMRI